MAGKSDGKKHDDQLGQKEPPIVHVLGAFAAGAVVVGSLAIVLFITWILHSQIAQIESSSSQTELKDVLTSQLSKPPVTEAQFRLVGQLIMESDAQFLRTERAQSLTAARLTVMIVAELVGLSLVVLGGALIFARIRGENKLDFTRGEPEGGTGKRMAYHLVSDFPGLFLCFFGTLVVIWALNTSVDENAKIKTTDSPMFFPSETREMLAYHQRLNGAENSDPRQEAEDKKLLETARAECIKSMGDAKLCE